MRVDLAGYVVNAVLVEGQSVNDVCARHDISRSWLCELIARYREQGEEGLKAKSKRPESSPTRISPTLEEEIVALRKELTGLGVDAGAHTIQYHLQRRRRRRAVPSVATIWRVLTRRGFVVPQPHKRPKSSWRRFQAELPNECWQADTTHWALADGTDVEILNIEDDHSRLLVASTCFRTTKAADVVVTFHEAAQRHGLPASMLTDNGAIFTAEARNGACVIELELIALGIDSKHSRPYHPQTCGKVERFHQTQRRWLEAQPQAATLAELQVLLDAFRAVYNQQRPHRGVGRRTPASVWAAQSPAAPPQAATDPATVIALCQVSAKGAIKPGNRLKIGLGIAWAGTAVTVIRRGDQATVIDTETGAIIRDLIIDPTRFYQATGQPRASRRKPQRPTNV
jgi:transposase InsO family protein